MSTTLGILCALGPIGAIDVVYYHLYRFRLFDKRNSRIEVLTHLARHACFLVSVVLLSLGSQGTKDDGALLIVLGLDALNSAIDVALEPRSRLALGGLPPGESVLHFLGNFGSGLAVATYYFERDKPFSAAPVALIAPLLAVGGGLLLLELVLLTRDCRARGGCVPQGRGFESASTESSTST